MKIDDRLTNFFSDFCDSDFWDFISGKVLILPSGTDTCFCGCFPILDDSDMLIDIRVSVPEVNTLKDMLINVHEFTHAIELYYEIGTLFIGDVDIREASAKCMERKYLNTFSKKNI